MTGTAAPSVTRHHGRASSSSADKLLLDCCKAIRKESTWTQRKLRQACDWAIHELERGQHAGAGLARYYRVVDLALKSSSEDLVEATLPQLQKLIG
ncbi:unnamed protein product [Sphacelaria rigidula]